MLFGQPKAFGVSRNGDHFTPIPPQRYHKENQRMVELEGTLDQLLQYPIFTDEATKTQGRESTSPKAHS